MSVASKRETLPIRSGAGPTGAPELLPKAEIRRLLTTSQLELLKGAGDAYLRTAGAVINAVVGIEDHIGVILTGWQGPDAEKARTALALLDTTGRELGLKLAQMGQSLEAYAGYIPPAIAELDGIKVAGTDPLVQEKLRARMFLYQRDIGGLHEAAAIAEVEDARAQDVLKKLNERILGLYATSVPESITYELPSVTPQTGPGASTRVGNGEEGEVRVLTSGSSSGSGSGDGDGTGGTRAGGTVEGITPRTADGDARPDGEAGAIPGTQPVDQGAGDRPVGVSQPGGVDGPAEPPAGGQDGNTGAGTADDTAPPVIGAEDRTAIEDVTAEDDPAQTETSAFQPTPPTIGNGPPSTVVPGTVPAPVGTGPAPVTTPPGVPPVIGSPKAAYTPSAGLPGMRGSAAGLSGMPFMPMMGGAGPVGQESGDTQRSTYLSEDKSAWSGGHDVTDPVIR
ncbi:hypothetical protein [Nonomuraea endophytica]|uniref:hypothetical protein n=1 Tax=Nonomuraea endophytica TaxID=714136 RepID=UPI0037C848E2